MNNKKKLCPMFFNVVRGFSRTEEYCIENRCAWWHGDKCALLSIAEELFDMNNKTFRE